MNNRPGQIYAPAAFSAPEVASMMRFAQIGDWIAPVLAWAVVSGMALALVAVFLERAP